MSINFNDLLDKAGDQLNGANVDLTMKSFTDSRGATKTMRDFADLASLQTIVKNQEATLEREAHGCVSRFERDFS